MAILTDGINTPTEELKVTSEYNVEIDLVNKSINKLQNFPVVMKGDNNSVAIVFKAPAEYNGVDLYGTNCIVAYNTTWKDDKGEFSTGQIDLTDNCEEIKEDGVTQYLLYTWILDIQQTYKVGQCNFSINFIMNLENDPYQDNVNVVIIDGSDGEQYFDSNSIIETELKYWSVSTSSVSFEIIDTNTSFNGDFNLIVPQDVGLAIKNLRTDVDNVWSNINNMSYEISSISNNVDNIEGNLNEINDYIVEQGTTEGITGVDPWGYEKWNSGKVVCWGHLYTLLSQIDTYNAWTFFQGTITAPEFVNSIQFANAQCNETFRKQGKVGVDGNKVVVEVALAYSDSLPSIIDGTFYVEIKGKWK